MALIPPIKENDWVGLRQALEKLSTISLGTGAYVTHGTMTLTNLTSTRLTKSDASLTLQSVTTLSDFVHGTANEIDVADDGSGGVNIGIVDPLAVNKGGTGQSSYTDGQLLIGNTTGNTLAKNTLTGTTNQVNVTNGAGTITLSLPQDIHTGATPNFVGLVLSGATITNPGGAIVISGSGAGSTGVAISAVTLGPFGANVLINTDNVSDAGSILIRPGNSSGVTSIGGGIELTPGTGVAASGRIFCNGTTRIQSLSGLLKGTSGVVSAAVAGSDYVATESDPVAMGYLDQSVKTTATPTFLGASLVNTSGNLLTVGYDASNSLTWICNSTGRHTITLNSSGTFAQYSIRIDKGGPGLTPPAADCDNLIIRQGASDTANARGIWAHAERNNTGTISSTYTTYGLNAFVYARGSGNLDGVFCGGRYGARGTGTAGIMADVRAVSAVCDASPSSGVMTFTNAVNYYSEAINANVRSTITSAYGMLIKAHTKQTGTPSGVMTNAYGIYLEQQTVGGTSNWQIYSAGGNSAFGGNTRLGGTTAPTVACDVTGAILASTTIEATTGFRCGGTPAAADGTYTPVVSITIKGGLVVGIS